VENADWIASRLHPFNAYDVGSVVPTGFATYARILHPAFTRDREVRWSEVAEWSGRVIHPEVQFHALVPAPSEIEFGTEPFVFPPRNGVLPEAQVRALTGMLSRFTTTADRCWFCLWDGYGDLGAGTSVQAFYTGSWAGRWARWRASHLRLSIRNPKPRRVSMKRVTPNPQRSYFLFSGSLDEAAGWQDGPALWWPDNRAWCVASEIDLPYTYVAGPKELIAEILENRALEVVPSGVDDGITYFSDKINSNGRAGET
jgi:hypothetical protein